MTMVEWFVSGAKYLRIIGRDFQKRADELRNDRSANLSLWKQVEGKDTDDSRNDFC